MGKKAISFEIKMQIIAYHRVYFSNVSIAQLLNISEHCVRNTIKKWEETGDVKDRKRSGRPRKTTTKEDSMLFRLSRSSPTSSLRTLSREWVNEDGSTKASIQTISRRLISFKLESYKAADKPFLNKLHRKSRLNWCLERRNWSYNKWSTIIFSDESNFELKNRKNKPYVRRFKNEKYDNRMVNSRIQGGGGSIGIWDCFSANGTGCCSIYSNRMNSVRY
jgi:transposase